MATEADPPGAGDDADVAPAFEFAGDTYDFYFTRFGRDSLDDAGLPLKSTVDYCDPSDACPLQNAFWNGQQMAYGDGFASADDVVGHELTHGVTEFSSHLFYYFQSGAINESLSDVFGEFVDQTNGAGNDTAGVKWQLGEDLPVGAIRNMKNPPAFGDPDRMTSPNYTIDQGEADAGGVHTNSGVNNKAAYLITDGTAADPGGTFNGRTITGLGVPRRRASTTRWRRAFLTSGSDYADLGSALTQACDNLVGTVGITAADCTQVQSAVAATEMATNPPNAPAPEAPAAACGANQVLQNRFFDDMEGTAATPTGPAGAAAGAPTIYYAHSGDINLRGDGPRTNRHPLARSWSGTSRSRRVRVVPALRPRLRVRGLRHDQNFDGGVLEFSTNGGSTLTDISALPVDVGYNGTIITASQPALGPGGVRQQSNGYRATRANLSSLAGQSVRFRWTSRTDGAGAGRGWFIDDVRIYSCLPDTDGDGVPNSADACPTVAGTQTATAGHGRRRRDDPAPGGAEREAAAAR